MTRFEHLNNLRILNGQKPLKAWKESKAKLEDAIRKLEPATEVEEVIEGEVKPVQVLFEEEEEARAESMQNEVGSVTRKLNLDEDQLTVTLVEIAKELSISPKIARAKIRRGGDRCPGSLEEDKYVYAIGDKQKVIDFLTSDFRKR